LAWTAAENLADREGKKGKCEAQTGEGADQKGERRRRSRNMLKSFAHRGRMWPKRSVNMRQFLLVGMSLKSHDRFRVLVSWSLLGFVLFAISFPLVYPYIVFRWLYPAESRLMLPPENT
jgi:hypothetical protein